MAWQSWGKRTAVTAAAVLGIVVAFMCFCFFTQPGHGVVATLIEPLTGGRVVVSGLSGALPNHLKAGRVELRDAQGAWLVITDVSLDWNALSALGDHVNITRLTAAQVTMLRREIPRPSHAPSTSTVDIGELGLDRIVLMKPVLGRAATLTARGSLHYTSRHDVAAELVIRRLDAAGRYDVHAAIAADIVKGTVRIAESGDGLAGGIVGMPDLGPVMLELNAAAKGSSNTVRLKFSANLLDISAFGRIDLAAEEADLDFSAVAPRMAPSTALSWTTISAKGHLHGPFTAPDIESDFRIIGLAARGTRIDLLTGAAQGKGGKVRLEIAANGLALPGEKAGVFAASPLVLTAAVDLNTPSRALAFALDHPLLHLSGTAATHGIISGRMTATVPSLARLEPLTRVKTDGNAVVTLDVKRNASGTDLTAKGKITTAGKTAIAKLLGTAGLDATARLAADGALALRAALKGAAIQAEVAGSQRSGQRSITGNVSLTDLSRLTAAITGTLTLRGSLMGPQDNAKLTISGTAAAATKGMDRQTITIAGEAAGLPNLKSANLRLSGHFDGSPVKLNSEITAAGADAWKVSLQDASWRSARMQGGFTIAGKAPRGSLRLAVARLADISPLIGAPLTGSIEAYTNFQPGLAAVHLSGANIVSGTIVLGRVDLNGMVRDPFAKPVLGLVLTAPQFATGAVSGSASARLSGPLNAVAANLTGALTTADGQALRVAAEALVDTAAKHVTVTRFQGGWRDQTVMLAAPASLDYAHDLIVAANLVDGKAATLSLTGTIPSVPGRSMTLRAIGKADLGALASELASSGQIVRGMLAVNLTVTGTPAKPVIIGTASLSKAEIQDYPRGLYLAEVEAEAEALGGMLRITKFTAKAGSGTITGSGTIDLAGTGTPVDIAFKANNARAVASDLLTADVDSDLKLDGRLSERLLLHGRIRVRRGSINIPEKFPREIVTLNIRRSRAAAPVPPPAPSALVALDLTLASPGQIFVRGRGLEAEFEGNLKIGGTSVAPQVQGALTMRRGTLSLAGANLTFQSGRISFNGQALRHRLDPTLDLVAQSQANGITATLKITGTASQPRIELSSSPPLPQDEVLSQLLFQQSAKSLSAMQLASVAQAAASLGGGGGFDPVGILRSSLGLDRLAVGSSQEGGSSTTTIEAGKYVFRNVYVGARQDLSGATRALVQVDITKHLKAQAQVITGPRVTSTSSTSLVDNGDSIGLSYQFEY